MARAAVTSVNAYLAAQPEAARAVLARVRRTIREALPQADEGISYRIPTYRMHGDPVLYFAGWKRHYSLYPATKSVMDAFSDTLASYEVEKGTIRFPYSQPVPVTLIGGIAKLRAREVATRDKRTPVERRKR